MSSLHTLGKLCAYRKGNILHHIAGSMLLDTLADREAASYELEGE